MTERDVELVKLARLLGADGLAHLAALDATALRGVREALSNTLFDASRSTLQRVAKASKLLPNGTAARVGEQVFGPLLCARIVGLLAPDHALDLSLRMADEFLADTSAELDPRRARELIAVLPAERVVAVSAVLVARGDYLTLARFVDHLSLATIEAVIASIADELALLHIATFVESKVRVAELLALIPRVRLHKMIGAITTVELWREALALTTGLDEHWQRTIGDLAAAHDDSVLTAMVATARQSNAWDTLLPLLAAMSEHGQRRLLALPAAGDDGVIAGLIGAADRLAMWSLLPPLLPKMPAALRDRVMRQLPASLRDRVMRQLPTTVTSST